MGRGIYSTHLHRFTDFPSSRLTASKETLLWMPDLKIRGTMTTQSLEFYKAAPIINIESRPCFTPFLSLLGCCVIKKSCGQYCIMSSCKYVVSVLSHAHYHAMCCDMYSRYGLTMPTTTVDVSIMLFRFVNGTLSSWMWCHSLLQNLTSEVNGMYLKSFLQLLKEPILWVNTSHTFD